MKEKQNCDHGFHLSLSQDLYSLKGPVPKCPECGRNYSEEDFIEACIGLKIDPSSVNPCFKEEAE